MAASNALKRAMKKYDQEKVDHISLRVPKGRKALIQEYAAARKESVNSFINRLIDQEIENNKIE